MGTHLGSFQNQNISTIEVHCIHNKHKNGKREHEGETTVIPEIMDRSKFEWKGKSSLWTFKDPEFHVNICFLNNWFVSQGAESYPECKSNKMISSVGWNPLFT